LITGLCCSFSQAVATLAGLSSLVLLCLAVILGGAHSQQAFHIQL